MNIVLVPNSYPPRIGGLEITVSCVAHELARAGNRVTVIAGSPAAEIADNEPDGIVVYRIPFFLPRLVTSAGRQRFLRSLGNTLLCPLTVPWNVVRFLTTVRETRPAVVNLHYLAENALFCLLARMLYRFKFVVNIHGSDIEGYSARPSLARWLARKTLRTADYVVANSFDLLAKAIRIEPTVEGKSSVIGNAVYPEDFSPTHKVYSEERSILCIANFSRNKGQDVLIRAFAQLRFETAGKARLLFAGDGPELARCRELADLLGVGSETSFLGRVGRDRIPTLLAESTVCVVPSRNEAFGVVALEAMASRKPVIATRVGGIQEIVQHMRNGLLVAPESPESLAEALALVLANGELAERLAGNGYRFVNEQYSWSEISKKYYDVFTRVTNKDHDNQGIT